jgi:hypothetical protein
MGLFKEHFIGGIISYSVFYFLALGASLALKFGLQWDVNKVSVISLNVWIAVPCFLIAVLSGLWPDVDIKSTTQKIFYRIFLLLDIVLIYKGITDGRRYLLISALLGVFAMLPLIGKHRGWTHSRITMFLLPALFLLPAMYDINPRDLSLSSFDYARLDYTDLSGLPLYVASFIGYATHLYLDGILFGKWQKKSRAKNNKTK